MTMHPAVKNGAYDVERIREDFPILGMQVYGKPLIYLDNAASAFSMASTSILRPCRRSMAAAR